MCSFTNNKYYLCLFLWCDGQNFINTASVYLLSFECFFLLWGLKVHHHMECCSLAFKVPVLTLRYCWLQLPCKMFCNSLSGLRWKCQTIRCRLSTLKWSLVKVSLYCIHVSVVGFVLFYITPDIIWSFLWCCFHQRHGCLVVFLISVGICMAVNQIIYCKMQLMV